MEKSPGRTPDFKDDNNGLFQMRCLHMQIIIARNGFVKRQYACSEQIVIIQSDSPIIDI